MVAGLEVAEVPIPGPVPLDVLLDAVQSPDAPDLVGWHWLGPIAHACAAITATPVTAIATALVNSRPNMIWIN